MKNTLLEELERISKEDPKRLVYIGTNKGSGFVLIEEAKKAIKKLDDVNKELYDKHQKSLSRAKSFIHDSPRRIVDIQDQLENCINSLTDEQVEKLREELRKLEQDFANAVRLRKELSGYLKNYVALKDRKILDTYDRQGYDPGICIIVNGIETNNIWFRNEKKEKTQRK